MAPVRILTALALLGACAPLPADEPPHPRVFRTFMPDSGPSAFAVELTPSLALCYDPLRGGLARAWRGRIDLDPTLRAKINEAAVVEGESFYMAEQVHPLRLGDPAAPAEYRFKGYHYQNGAVVFEFTLRGHRVSETLRAHGDGLLRELVFPAEGGPAFLRVEPQKQASLQIRGGEEIEPGLWRFPAGGKASIEIRPKTRAEA